MADYGSPTVSWDFLSFAEQKWLCKVDASEFFFFRNKRLKCGSHYCNEYVLFFYDDFVAFLEVGYEAPYRLSIRGLYSN